MPVCVLMQRCMLRCIATPSVTVIMLDAGGPMRPEDIGHVTEVDDSDPVMSVQVEFGGKQYW